MSILEGLGAVFLGILGGALVFGLLYGIYLRGYRKGYNACAALHSGVEI